MAENLFIPTTKNKQELYQAILPQIKAVVSIESDLIANLANTAAILKEAFGFFWVGFYLDKGENLVLAPFQGSLACTRIAYGKGVCGAAFAQKKTIIVPDVEQFEGHIACSSLSKSEIVVPIFVGEKVVGVLDVDSDVLNDFDEVDALFLEEITRILVESLGIFPKKSSGKIGF